MNEKDSILLEAHKLVHGDRQEAYSHPLHDYGCTAAMWQAMMQKKYGVVVPLDAEFACLMMAAMKLSRACGNYKRDTLVDLAGYAECADMAHNYQTAGIGVPIEVEKDHPASPWVPQGNPYIPRGWAER